MVSYKLVGKFSKGIFLIACILGSLTACVNGNDVPIEQSPATPKFKPIIINGVVMSTQTGEITDREYFVTPYKPRDMQKAPLPVNIVLTAPSEQDKKSLNKSAGAPLGIGIYRDVLETDSVSKTKDLLHWQTASTGGKIAAINIKSIGSKNTDIAILVKKLPNNAILRVYSSSDTTYYPLTGAQINDKIAQKLSSDSNIDARHIYWTSQPTAADNTTLEIELPPSVQTDELEIAIPKIAHDFFLSIELDTQDNHFTSQILNPEDPKELLYCHTDISCQTRPKVSNSTVYLRINGSTQRGVCSGTLISDNADSGKPYVLTAAHCIRSQDAASDVKINWFYRSSVCNASTPQPIQADASGATFLISHEETDSSLLLLNSAAPAGAVFAGWDATTRPYYFDQVAGIHHPIYAPQKISTGTIKGFYNYQTVPVVYDGTVMPAFGTTSNLISTSLLIQGGSSGSGLYKNISSSNPQLIGVASTVLPPSCYAENTSYYGRFDMAFPTFKQWLSPSPPTYSPVYRFRNLISGDYFYTIYEGEKASVLANYASVFRYEGPAFRASATFHSSLSPVFRFRNNRTGAYLHTAYKSEYNSILANPGWGYVYEGIAWYAEMSSNANNIPLHRFATPQGSYFYTANEYEKNWIRSSLPSFMYQGVSYFVRSI